MACKTGTSAATGVVQVSWASDGSADAVHHAAGARANGSAGWAQWRGQEHRRRPPHEFLPPH
eukprot:3772828-Pyramimonas_sp.AAC.2